MSKEIYKESTNKKVLAIDFDDTIAVQGYPECGKLIKGAKKVINKLYDEGHHIIIWTCRMEEPAAKAIEFLKKNGIKYHTFNDHAAYIKEHYGNDTRKIFADVYIDDKQLGGLPSWDKIYKILKEKHSI